MAQRFSITLTQLSYFLECAKTLNMTDASQELHVAQSAVSTAISQLERALGAPLFVRQHSKGLVLTVAGEGLLHETREIFGHINDAIESFRAEQREVRGTLVVACFKTILPFLLPQVLKRMHERFPELTVEVIEVDHEESIDALRSGRVELALSYDLTDVEGIWAERIGCARPHVIVSPAHRLAKQNKASLAELADDPFVLLDLPDSREYFLSMLRTAGITPKISYRSSNYETVRSLVAMGLGFSLLNLKPRIKETYTGERVAILEVSDPVPSLHVTAFTLAKASQTARAKAFTETARKVVAETLRS
jgi:DNA-binding transcriptional LysR family regulator